MLERTPWEKPPPDTCPRESQKCQVWRHKKIHLVFGGFLSHFSYHPSSIITYIIDFKLSHVRQQAGMLPGIENPRNLTQIKKNMYDLPPLCYPWSPWFNLKENYFSVFFHNILQWDGKTIFFKNEMCWILLFYALKPYPSLFFFPSFQFSLQFSFVLFNPNWI